MYNRPREARTNMLTILIKLGLAVVLGGAIGLEREFSQKPAGLRTNILICMGSAMMMAMSDALLADRAAGSADSLRIAAGVITGMGFIGAGAIIRAGGHVHGLTTASTLWAVTALGLVVGSGLYLIAVVFAAVIILNLIAFRKIEGQIPRKGSFTYVFRTADRVDLLAGVRRMASSLGVRIEDAVLKRSEGTACLTFNFMARERVEEQLRGRLSQDGEIVEIRMA